MNTPTVRSWNVRRMVKIDVVAIVVALLVLVLDVWAVSQGLATTPEEKRFVGIVALGALGLLTAGLFALCCVGINILATRFDDRLRDRC